jgi:hypothetical protein
MQALESVEFNLLWHDGLRVDTVSQESICGQLVNERSARAATNPERDDGGELRGREAFP